MDPQPQPQPQPESEPVTYICGNCRHENTLKAGDVFQCRECRHRVLYKKRARRTVQYEAR